METKTGRKISKQIGEEAVEFALTGLDPISSGAAPDEYAAAVEAETPTGPVVAAKPKAQYSQEFLELSEPKLPSLAAHGNRARLLMQTPNRLYFYWALGKNPFHTLSRSFGGAASYELVLKLIDLTHGSEEIHPVDAAGNWWFTVDADTEYRAEIGFYAVNRPYIRVLFSNTVITPRKGPSPRTAETAEWRVPAEHFARVLDVAGFSRDAFDVALAGDDIDAADIATRSAFAQFSGRRHEQFERIESSEIRYAMLALASGVTIEQLKGLISDHLFNLLSSAGETSGERALTALKDKFEFDAEEFEVEEDGTEAVFGASLVNFPKRRKRPGRPRELGPISSHDLISLHDLLK